MDLAELKSIAQELKAEIESQQAENRKTEVKIQEENQILMQLDEEQEKKVFKIETMNMMTKYQIVFLKLEACTHKIMANNEARKRMKVNIAFRKWKEQTVVERTQLQYTSIEVANRMMTAFKNLAKIKQSQKSGEGLRRAFEKWRIQSKVGRLMHTMNEKKQRKIERIETDIEKKTARTSKLMKQKKDIEGEIDELRRMKDEQRLYLKDLIERKETLDSELSELKEQKKNPTRAHSDARIARLEKEIAELEAENDEISTRANTEKSNVSDFISQMDGILEEHDITNILSGFGDATIPQDILDPDEVNLGQMPEEVEQAHAGTGGSSKIKSRPRNAHRY